MKTRLTIDEAEVLVYEEGEGIPVVMLHGSPDSHAMWLPLIERISHKARTIAPDLPGFGATALPDSFALTLDHEADFIAKLMDALKVNEPVVLVSMDFGSHYALAFTVKYPDRVRGNVISNTAFSRDYQWHSFARLYRVPVLGEFLLGGTSKAMAIGAMKRYAPALPDAYLETAHTTGFGSAKTRKAILRHYRERDPQDFAGWDEKLVALHRQKPALVLWGDLDPFASAGFAECFGAQNVQHFPNYSHWLPLEAPQLYAEKLLVWLETV
jgi:pimeloyl-ACP methyl ester carboxylesterase